MLTIQNLCWSLPDGTPILDGIDLQIPAGKLTVVTGPNGGGKTSLAKLIAGLEQADSGRIILDGTDITNFDITSRARNGVCYAFQQPVRFKGISVRDMLSLAAGCDIPKEEACGYLHQVGLCAQDYINREVNASLSGGEIKRIEIAGVLARRNAKVLIFDEPEAGIDLWSFNGLIDTFQQLKQRNDCALLIISHQERILNIADEIAVIADGRIRESGPAAEILPRLLSGEKACRCPLGKEEAKCHE